MGRKRARLILSRRRLLAMAPKTKKQPVEIRAEFWPTNIPNLDRGRIRYPKWHHTTKYYRGSPTMNIWQQDLYRRSLLERETTYLDAIHNGTHSSLAKFP